MAKPYTVEKLDASENAFLRRELEAVRTAAFQVEFPNQKGRDFLPIDNSVDTGAEIVTFATTEGVGKSLIGGAYSTESPRVDVKISDESQRVVSLRASYGYSIQEVRAAILARRGLVAMKSETCRDTIEQDMQQLMLLGSTTEGLEGLFTLTNTTSHTISAGAAASLLWINKTAEEVATDLHNIVHEIINSTAEVEKPETLILPTTAFQFVTRTRMGDGSDKTILQYFRENNEFITNVDFSQQLETAGAGSTRRMMAYSRNARKLQGIEPQSFEQFPPQERGLETVIECHARWGGIEKYKPKSIAYGDAF